MNEDASTTADHQQRKQVVIVAMSGNILLNFSGPADVFTSADRFLNQSGSKMGYDVLIVSPSADKKVLTAAGMEITCQYSAMEITTPVDTLIVAGNDFQAFKSPEYDQFWKWLASINEHNTR